MRDRRGSSGSAFGNDVEKPKFDRAAMHDSIMNAHRHLLDALRGEMAHRAEHDDWEQRERLAITNAANEWMGGHDIGPEISVNDVERVEGLAVGHSDYASKLALYVAELIHGVREIQP